MLYLLDANVLIDANRDYYPIRRIPEFWDWLCHRGEQDLVKVPLEVYEEVQDAQAVLGDWLRDPEIKEKLLLREEAVVEVVSRVVEEGYAADLGDDEILKLGRDPFLIAYAMSRPESRFVVTTEASNPRQPGTAIFDFSRVRGNRHIPDVCASLGIRCVNTFTFVRELDFSTGWRSSIG